MGTLNIQNIKGNTKYLQSVLASTDILCIQEHWLFTFEQKLVDDSWPDYCNQLKCVDEDQPITHLERIRGYGGTLTLWRTSIDKYVKRLPDGSHRMSVIIILTKPVPSILINVYLPSRNSRTTDSFQETLDSIAETIYKYGTSHNVILAGDMNSSLHRVPPNCHDLIFREFVNKNGLLLSDSYKEKSTFFHHNGKDRAVIDYILMRPLSDSMEGFETTIKDLNAENTSDHTLVTATVQVKLPQDPKIVPASKGEKHTLKKKCRWNKCDIQTYHQLVEDNIDTADISDGTSTAMLGIQCKVIENILHSAASQSIPDYHRDRTNKSKGKGTWSPDIQSAAMAARRAHREWKDSGSPQSREHPANQTRRESKRKLRRLQRQTHARKQLCLQREIMDASDFDQKLFYRLVNKQRSSAATYTDTLEVDGVSLTTPEDVIEGWKVHFERLATPSSDNNFNEQHYDIVMLQDLVIQQVCRDSPKPSHQVTAQDVYKAINSLSNNKAADAFGLTAEHFKLAADVLADPLMHLLNNIIKQAKLPEPLKLGVLSPVLKKGKAKTVPGNYRGITVTPIISKILEATLQHRLDDILLPTQNKLQRGFTAKTSPLSAALLVSESLNEAKDNKQTCALATLDAEKAFDTVWHQGLAVKLYHAGIEGKLWLLLRDMQTSGQTAVKWSTHFSDPFPTQQGIRQGAKLSTSLYKRFNNGILDQIQNSNIGAKVGSLHIGAPTVADDISLIADKPEDLQRMLNVVNDNTSKDRFRINHSKSDVVIYNATRSREKCQWNLGTTTIDETTSTTHIGLHRASTLDADINTRVEKGRKTMYALLGAGLHGRTGLNPLVSTKLWAVFGLTRMIYGLEVVKLKRKEIDSMEIYQRKLLRQIQFLPDRCPNTAIYALTNSIPIESQIDKRLLSMYVGTIKQTNTLEYQVIRRQLAVKGEGSHSWTIEVRRLLSKYGLPSAYDLWEDPPSKEKWKKMLGDAFNSHFYKLWTMDVAQKSSLRYLHISERPLDSQHPIWASASSDTREIRKASIKVRLLTGTYTLQSNRSRFNQFEVSPNCCLCQDSPEDRMHFILKCKKLSNAREKHLLCLREMLTNRISQQLAEHIMCTDDLLLQCLMDATDPKIFLLVEEKLTVVDEIETISRNLIQDVDAQRAKLLNSGPGPLILSVSTIHSNT
ncbi:MAG: reverse transcriptase family protein [Sedimenticola sp.]